MDEYFSTQATATLFGVSHQTIKNWAEAFEEYLSPRANPGTGRKRVFAKEDLEVFGLINEFHKQGFTHTDAKAALGAGQRGQIPDTTNAPMTVPPAIILQLRDEVNELRQQLLNKQSGWDQEKGKVQLLQSLLDKKEEQIRLLYEENAVLKAQQKLSKKD